jgi:trigger factor
MNIVQNNIDELNAELVINLEPSDYKDRVEKAIKDYRKKTQMPGFRPGHVPASLIKQRYGKSILAEEINNVLQDSIHRYIADNKIKILGSPMPKKDNDFQGNWEDPGEFKFSYELGLSPELTVELDKSQSFAYYKMDVDQTLVDRQMRDIARRYGKMSDPEVSEAEDMVMCDFVELKEDGEVKEGGIFSKSTVSIEYIKDAETQAKLIGIKRGDSLVVDPHKLNTNHEELAKMLGVTHHDVHHLQSMFKLTVTDIKRIEAAELNEEFFLKVYGEEIKSEEEMRERTKADLEIMFARDSDFLFKKDFAIEITNRLNPQLPDGFLKRWIKLTNEKPVSEEMVELEYPVYSQSLRWQLIENQIIRQYELRVMPEDAINHVKQVLGSRYASYGMPIEDEQLEDMAKKALSDQKEAKNVYDFLYEEQMIAMVKENCTIEENVLSYDEFVHRVQH